MSNMISYWEQAIIELSKKDKKLKNIIIKNKNSVLITKSSSFITLNRAIIGQQISVKAAESIWEKILIAITPFTAENIIKYARQNPIKEVGISHQKSNYLLNIAHFFVENDIKESYWNDKPYAEIYRELISIKGIGKWTVEMFAIFYLAHPDIFPINDLGLIRAIKLVYEKETLTTDELIELSGTWKPWRTVATWYLWRSIDPHVVNY